jgi:predicted DCC family thiol-disulfide oxidoreductase YuxK
MEATTTPILIYDGECSFCSTNARWIAARWPGPEQAIAWQQLTVDQLEQFGLTADQLRRAAWWIDSSRRPSRGHLAIAHALEAAHGWPSVAGRVLLAPPFRWLAAAAYPLVARWRHRLPGGTKACRRPT